MATAVLGYKPAYFRTGARQARLYAGENMLVINPDECIGCGVCEPECPAEVITPYTEPGLESWLKLNKEFSAKWPKLTVKGVPPADAKERDGVQANSAS